MDHYPLAAEELARLRCSSVKGATTFSKLVKQETDCVREVHNPRGEAAIGVKFNCDNHIIGDRKALLKALGSR